MSASDKISLFPKYGHLFPNVHMELATCTTIDKIQAVLRTSASLCGYLARLSTVDNAVFDKVRCIVVCLIHSSWLVGSGTLRRRTKIMWEHIHKRFWFCYFYGIYQTLWTRAQKYSLGCWMFGTASERAHSRRPGLCGVWLMKNWECDGRIVY